ncbi:MAG: hypothetical protein ABJJ44_06260 [Paraglaciecola sp.]|uniref:hypothetical protein n=1 Tax=Paraglaciecola sp. TaxID=1920173 RepID=UPI00329827D5
MKIFLLMLTISIGFIWWFILDSAPKAKLEYTESNITAVELKYTGHAIYYDLKPMDAIRKTLKETSLPSTLISIDEIPSFLTEYDKLGPIVNEGTTIYLHGTYLRYTPSKIYPVSGKMNFQLVKVNDDFLWMDTENL